MDDTSRPGDDDLDALRAENAELRRRVEEAERALDELRVEALARRAQVRELAESLPAAMSRRVLVRSMLSDVVHHPDPGGVVRRGLAKLGRAPRRAWRSVVARLS